MNTPSGPSRARGLIGSGIAIAVAIGVMNLANYAFTVLAAHELGPRPFGALIALLNVMQVAAVLSLALQATAARRIAREPDDVSRVERLILKVGLMTSLGLGAFFLVLSPAVDAALKLDNPGPALLLAVSVVPITMMGAQAGVLQGERRWLPLALLYLAAGVPRLVLGAGLLAWRPDETVAMLALTIGSFAPVVVGSLALRRRIGGTPPRGEHTARALWWETAHNSQALLAFLVLSNVDIVIARNALEPKQAGLYAAGLILAKAVAFAPQFVVVLAFPSMGTDVAPRRALFTSLLLISALGLALTAAVRILPDLSLVFVGGDQYAAIKDRLWIFAVLGTAVAVLQLLVYNVLARRARSALLLWVGLAVLVVAGLNTSSVTALIERVLLVDGVLLVALTLISLRGSGQRPEEVPALGQPGKAAF